jgi:hypothetical protein
MHGQLLLGLAISLVNIAIHATIMTSVTWSAHHTLLLTRSAHPRLRVASIMIAAVSILMLAHYIEIAVWGGVYRLFEVAPNAKDAFYFAFVNYTTLGYGDMLPVEYWQLLGPITAMNGVLLFGWSTAVIYDVLRSTVRAIPCSYASKGDEA